MDIIPIVQVSLLWMRIMHWYMQQKYKEEHWRRYWVKPHLYPTVRNTHGAFAVAFSYMKVNNHEEFYEIYRMNEHQFDQLHEMLRKDLQKVYAVREPLSSELKLAVMLQYILIL